MFYTIIQYIFIAVVFVIAVIYMVKMARNSFTKKSCSKGCGCDETKKELK